MEAVIIAGGKGTRLSAMTREVPKPMLPVQGRPILEYQIEEFRSNGVKDIVLTVGYLKEAIQRHFGDGKRFGVRIAYVEEEMPLGSAGAFCQVKEFVSDAAFVVYGDVLFSADLGRMLEWHRRQSAMATLFVHPNSHPHDSDIVLYDEAFRATGFLKKQEDRTGLFYRNCVNAGLFVVQREAMEFFQRPEKLDFEKDFLRCLIEKRQVAVYRSTEYVKDMGTYDRLAAVEENVRRGIARRRNLGRPQKCIFLDRDGTVNVLRGLIDRPDMLELAPGAGDAIRSINESGYLAVVITNQPVIARGMCTVEELERIHMKLEMLLGEKGAYLDRIYYCPHHPDGGYEGERPAYKVKCECRKPGIGLILQAARDCHIALGESWLIGDSTSDVQAGKNAGLKTILLETGEGGKDGKCSAVPDARCRDLKEAVEFILGS